tara:strand:+ start:254 stop:367 length:114 start_codon:yes stop_codon:yes gene_type:complete
VAAVVVEWVAEAAAVDTALPLLVKIQVVAVQQKQNKL